jgi:hypothetical protein
MKAYMFRTDIMSHIFTVSAKTFLSLLCRVRARVTAVLKTETAPNYAISISSR